MLFRGLTPVYRHVNSNRRPTEEAHLPFPVTGLLCHRVQIAFAANLQKVVTFQAHDALLRMLWFVDVIASDVAMVEYSECHNTPVPLCYFMLHFFLLSAFGSNHLHVSSFRVSLFRGRNYPLVASTVCEPFLSTLMRTLEKNALTRKVASVSM